MRKILQQSLYENLVESNKHNISTKSESWLKRLGEIGPGSHLQPADVKMSKKSGIIPEKIVIVRF